jgi:hypothetical protein
MKSLSKNWMVGLVASVVVFGGVCAALAGPPPKPYYKYPHYEHWHQPPVFYGPRVAVVRYPVANVVYDAPDASNPAPLADIRLINPARNGVALRFRLDSGDIQTLPAGTSVALTQAAVISFNRGGVAGWAHYQLTDGAYHFAAANGAWDLVHETSQTVGMVTADSSNPVPGN